MKPSTFRYHAPSTLEEALELLAALEQDDAEGRILAGGQSLMPMMNLRLARPEHLVDVNGIAELAALRHDNGHLLVGAMVRQRTAERSEDVASGCPLLAQALPSVGHTQIRNRGTIGGSLAHADPAAEIPTIAVAIDATITLSRAGGQREVPAEEFFHGYLETAIAPGELLTAVRFPRPGPRTGSAFKEVSRRHGDFAMVGLAASVQLAEDGTVADARLAYLGVSSVPVRLRAAETALQGVEPGPDAFAAAAAAAREQLSPPTDLHASADYRRHVAGVLTDQLLPTATDRARSAG